MKKDLSPKWTPKTTAEDKKEQLETVSTDDKGHGITTNQGLLLTEDEFSLRAGERGPTLLEDFHLREKIMHFDHERIPERIVHARGVGAHGYFKLEKDMSDFTYADFLTDLDMETPVFVRFSTVQGSRGSTDMARDIRGFAMKFYTNQGNFDLVGNNVPVFFIQDAIKFPDFIHAVKPEPKTEVPQAASAHDTFWDFVANNEETVHTVLWAMSDRAIPRSLRMMEGFGVHTFRWINREGRAHFVKWHLKPELGTHSLLWDENQKISGKDPDFHRKDLYEAIDAGIFPQWRIGVQLIPEEDEFKFDFDLLDPTKLVPEEVVPITFFGRMTLNRNVENFFAETEQVAFHPGHLVPGIDFTNDPLLQGRLFSYTDTQLIRLGGPNFHQIPINRPVVPVHNNQRDGYHQSMIHKSPTSYHKNELSDNYPRPVSREEGGFEHYQEKVEGRKIRARADSFKDFHSQGVMFLNSLTPVERQHVEDAFVFELSQVKSETVRQHVVDLFAPVDSAMFTRVAEKIGAEAPKAETIKYEKTSPALSQMGGPKKLETLKVAVLIDQDTDQKTFSDLIKKLKGEKVTPVVVGPYIGTVNGIETEQSFTSVSPVLFDGVAILSKPQDDWFEGVVKEYAEETFKHFKSLGLVRQTQSYLTPEQRKQPGVVMLSQDNTKFIEALTQRRHWERPQVGTSKRKV